MMPVIRAWAGPLLALLLASPAAATAPPGADQFRVPERSLGIVAPVVRNDPEAPASLAPRAYSSSDTLMVFADDLEALTSPSNEGGWTHVDDSFEPTAWNISSLYGCGTNVFWCGVVDSSWTGDSNRMGYANSWNQTLENFVDLAGAPSPYTMTFNHRMNIESGHDHGYIEVFDPNDLWITIASFTGVLNNGSPACGPVTVTIPDSIVAKTNPVHFRFRFQSDIEGSSEDGLYNGDGWAIDDVTVKGGVFDVRFFDDMESGLGTWTRSVFPAVGDYWRIASNVTTQQVCTTNTTKVWDVTSAITGALVPRLDDLLVSPPISVNKANQVFLFFDVYRRLPFDGCFYYRLGVRTRNIGSPGWSAWVDPTNLLYYGVEQEWLKQTVPLTAAAGVDSIQFRIEAKDFGQIYCGGSTTTSGTALFIDNLKVGIIGAGGPTVSVEENDLFNDTFRTTPFFGNDNFNTPYGDSTSVRVGAARGLKSASFLYSLNGGAFTGIPLVALGSAAPGVYYADVPAASYPRGTELRYYFSATDSMDAVTTLPIDAVSGSHYFRATVLPAIQTPSTLCSGDTARILYVNAWAGPDASTGVEQSLIAIGARYDRYDVNAAAQANGNTPGGGNPANPGPLWPATPLGTLGAYRAIVWDVGERSSETLSAQDQSLLAGWLALTGANRGLLLSGDNVAYDLVVNGKGITNFMTCALGANFLRDNWETAPLDTLSPQLLGSAGTRIAGEPFPVDGGCPSIDRFDALSVASCSGGAGRGWLVYPNTMLAGTERQAALGTLGADSSKAILLGFSLASMPNKVRRNLLLYRTLTEEFEVPACYAATGVPEETSPPSFAGARLDPVAPNPFNPHTTVRFWTGSGGRVQLRVYDVRGALVRTLTDGYLPPGPHEAVWDGRDDRGHDVGSGAYFIRLSGLEFHLTRKAILLR
jgi:hypothetical protein